MFKRTILVFSLLFSAGLMQAQNDARMTLTTGWFIQPSTEVQDRGETISTAEYKPKHWYPTSVPATVVAALVHNQVYADPYFGMNLRNITGVDYPIGQNFSNIPMPPESAFRAPWWYRTQFTPPADYRGKRVLLHFDGINFRANVWLNGKQIAGSDKMAGAWRLFEIDVTDEVRPGAPNGLAVEVFPPTPDDLAITFVDWNPAPPDKGMGIWRGVYLTASGPVALRFPQVITKFDLPSLDKAHLTVTAEVRNVSTHAVKGVLKGQIENIQFSQPVTVERGETKVVTFAPDQFQQLNLTNPRVWWPVQLGPQNLYTLALQFETGGAVSDQLETRFGVREVTSELDKSSAAPQSLNGHGQAYPDSHRIFSINGQRILIRGAGYTFDMLLRESPEREEQELKYVRDMNLNTVRLEGKIVDDNFLRLTDEYGILVSAGWCCCDHWERWQNWDDEDRVVAAESLRDQIRRIRSHPSVFNWMNGSDNPPPPDVEQMYIGILKQLNWPNPYESSATAKPTTVSGETGVKMTGPYEYVAPSYWELDKERGGAHGFNTETSPGPAVPPIDSLRRMLPEDHLWPINSMWDYHAGGGAFRTINVFTTALNARYGPSSNVEDFAMKSQVMAYEGERAMFEAYGRNKYVSTGVIQWMLNNAWPSMIWHLYDYYLRPGGSYFGAKKGCEPLHIQYSYDDHSIVIVNSYHKPFTGLKASAKVYNLDMTEKFSKDAPVDVASDGVQRVFNIPDIDGLSKTFFVALSLADSSGKQVSENFYWLSTQPDILDWAHSSWYHTPTQTFSDLTGLNSLPRVDLNVTSTSEVNGADGLTHVTVTNPGRNLAFAVHLRVMRPARFRDPEAENNETELLPVMWEDNYFALLPGETRQITATYSQASAGRGPLEVWVDGWNVSAKSLPAGAGSAATAAAGADEE